MTDPSPDITIPPDVMASAEQWLGYYAALNATEGATYASIVRGELDRLRAELATAAPVVEAARAYIAHLDAATTRDGRWFERNQKHLDVLAARVRTHTDTTTEKG